MIFVAWHLGLGDAIACAAIVAKLAESGEQIAIPCFDKNEVSVKSFFVNQPNVTIRKESDKVQLPNSENDKVLSLGFYNKEITQLPEEDFVQWFYRQAGMDISEKEKYCPIKKASENQPQYSVKATDFMFLHDDKNRGFIIDRSKVKKDTLVTPSAIGQSILAYSDIISSANTLHCIDSSFIHLAEALGAKGERFYHKYARPNSTEFKYLRQWEVIN